MKIIVGLGNPTKEYAGTRHNVGFSVIYNISDAYNIPVETKKHKALIGKGIIEGEKVILAGFGVFEVKERAERTGRNPQTKEEILIPASRTPSFKPGKPLKEVMKG